MKNTILLLTLIFTTLTSFSQNRLDSLILDEVNKYRNCRGLSEIVWDDSVYVGSYVHTDYMTKIGNITHYEEEYVKGHTNKSLTERISSTSHPDDVLIVNVMENLGLLTTAKGDKIKRSDEELAVIIVKMWDESPTHNRILNMKPMLSDVNSKGTMRGAVSSIKTNYGKEEKWKNRKNPWVYVTLNFVESY